MKDKKDCVHYIISFPFSYTCVSPQNLVLIVRKSVCINIMEDNGLIKCKGEVEGRRQCRKLLGVITPSSDRRKVITLFNVRRRKCVRKRTHTLGTLLTMRELTKAETAVQPTVASLDQTDDSDDGGNATEFFFRYSNMPAESSANSIFNLPTETPVMPACNANTDIPAQSPDASTEIQPQTQMYHAIAETPIHAQLHHAQAGTPTQACMYHAQAETPTHALTSDVYVGSTAQTPERSDVQQMDCQSGEVAPISEWADDIDNIDSDNISSLLANDTFERLLNSLIKD